MNGKKVFILVLVVGLGGLIIWKFWMSKDSAQISSTQNTSAQEYVNPNSANTTVQVLPAPAFPTHPLISVNQSDVDQLLSSPLTITGKAKGNWYFEASFPVELKNNANVVIATGVATAQGDWMTTNFVPFTVTLTFPPQPNGSTGTLVLKKDNPSGEPANDDQLVLPVSF